MAEIHQVLWSLYTMTLSVCMRLAQVHQASLARCAGAATSHGQTQTCLCRWPSELRRSKLVATCPSLLSKRAGSHSVNQKPVIVRSVRLTKPCARRHKSQPTTEQS